MKARPLFRRTPSAPAPTSPDQEPHAPGGKGRPTPSRKEAEAAARERARLHRDPKAARRRQRELRMANSRKLRQAIAEGDEKSLPARDRGPVRRYVRDLVDSRIGFTELLAPMLILIMVLGYGAVGQTGVKLANSLWFTTMLLVVLDMVWLRFKVRRNVSARFPDAPLKGLTWYALMRAVNMRFLRLPKPRVKIGQALPEHYR